MEKNEINLNGRLFNLKRIEDRSKVYQIIKDAMEGCDEDYIEAHGDFKIDI